MTTMTAAERFAYLQRRTLRVGRLQIFACVIDRGSNGVTEPWLGFCGGCWLPWVRLTRDAYIGRRIDAQGLCFHLSATFFPTRQD